MEAIITNEQITLEGIYFAAYRGDDRWEAVEVSARDGGYYIEGANISESTSWMTGQEMFFIGPVAPLQPTLKVPGQFIDLPPSRQVIELAPPPLQQISSPTPVVAQPSWPWPSPKPGVSDRIVRTEVRIQS